MSASPITARLLSLPFFFRLLLAALLLVPAGAPRAGSTPGEGRRVRVVIAPLLSYAPLWIAEKEGFFEEEGVAVELIQMTRTSEGIPTLAAGKVEVLASHVLPSHFNVIARGAHVRIVADKGHHDPNGCTYEALVATPALLASGRLDRPDGFEGLRVATDKSMSGFFYVDTLLSSLGVSAEVLRTFDLPLASKADGFRNGAVDFSTAAEPWLTKLLDTGEAVVWKPVEDFVPGFQSSVILFGPSLLDGNRETAVRFLAGYLRGVRRYNEGKTDRNVEIVAEATGLDPDLVRRACWISIDPDGAIDAESLIDYQRWALREGLLDRVVPIDEFYDSTFAASAVDLLRSREGR